jgi:hypothetical protein
MVAAPKKGKIKLKVGAATGPAPSAPTMSALIIGHPVTPQQFKDAFAKTVKEQHDNAVAAIKNMPPEMEAEFNKLFGVTKDSLLKEAAKYAPGSSGILKGYEDAKAKAAKPEMSLQAVMNDGPENPHGGWLEHKPEMPSVPGVLNGVSGKLDKVTNPETKSTFHVVGSLPNGLRLSLRFWRPSHHLPTDKRTVISFRLRIGDQNPVDAPQYVEITNVLAYCNKHFPGLGFSATAIKSPNGLVYPHASIEGYVDFPNRPHEKDEIALALEHSKFVDDLWATLQSFTDTLALDAPDFYKYVDEQIMTAIGNQPAMTPAQSQPVKYKLGPTGMRLMDSEAKPKKLTKKELLSEAGL